MSDFEHSDVVLNMNFIKLDEIEKTLREAAAWCLDHEVLSRYVEGEQQEHKLKILIENADKIIERIDFLLSQEIKN